MALSDLDPAEFQKRVNLRRQRRMDYIDAITPEHQAIVHEYNLTILKAFVDIGVTEPKHMRHLAETVLNEMSATRGANSSQGRPTDRARQ